MDIPKDIGESISEAQRKKWVQDYPELKAYEDGLKSINSKQHCTKDVIRYCRIVGKTPTELCNLGTTRDDKIIEASKLLKAFCNTIENWVLNHPAKLCPLKYTMAWSISKSMRGFYRENLLDLPKAIGKLPFPTPSEERTYTPTREDLRHFREETKTFRDRVLVHWLSTIPLRKNEIRGILWNDFDLTEEYPYVVLSAERLKGKYPNVWFVGVICQSLKKELKKLREEQKKKFEKNGLKWSEFTKVFITHKFNRKLNAFAPIGYAELGRIANNARKKVIKKYNVDISLQDVRRYFENRLDYAESQGVSVPRNFREWFLAHKLKGSKPHYNKVKASVPQIIEVFKQLEPYIDLDYSEANIKKTMLDKWKQLENQGKSKEEIIGEMYEEIKGMMQLITQRALTEQQRKASE